MLLSIYFGLLVLFALVSLVFASPLEFLGFQLARQYSEHMLVPGDLPWP